MCKKFTKSASVLFLRFFRICFLCFYFILLFFFADKFWLNCCIYHTDFSQYCNLLAKIIPYCFNCVFKYDDFCKTILSTAISASRKNVKFKNKKEIVKNSMKKNNENAHLYLYTYWEKLTKLRCCLYLKLYWKKVL